MQLKKLVFILTTFSNRLLWYSYPLLLAHHGCPIAFEHRNSVIAFARESLQRIIPLYRDKRKKKTFMEKILEINLSLEFLSYILLSTIFLLSTISWNWCMKILTFHLFQLLNNIISLIYLNYIFIFKLNPFHINVII